MRVIFKDSCYVKPRNIPNKPREKDGQIEFTFCTNESIFTTGSFVARPKPGMCLLFPNSLYHQVYPFQALVREEVSHSIWRLKDLVNLVEYNSLEIV